MASLNQVPINNFTGGPQTSAGFAVPAVATNVVVDFDGSTLLDPAVNIDTVIEFAPDGVTWRPIAGANFRCGSKMRDGVTPRAIYSVTTEIPFEGNNRKLRGTMTVNGGVISTVLSIRTSP